MNREFLKGLGLEDEAIDKVMAEHGKTLNDTKNQLETVTTEKGELESQLSERDGQLEELKKVDAEGLQTKITELQTANETTKTEYEASLKDLQLTNAIKLAVNGKVHDEDVATTLIDKEQLVISDDGEIVGLDKQIESLKESKAYLFKSDAPPANDPQIVPPGNPNGGGGTTKSIDQMSYQELADLKTNNPAKFAELTK